MLGTHGHFISNFVKNFVGNYFSKIEKRREEYGKWFCEGGRWAESEDKCLS